MMTRSFFFFAYPILKTSASFRKAELIRMGNGNRSIKEGNFTMASHCSPTLVERRPGKKKETHVTIKKTTEHNV